MIADVRKPAGLLAIIAALAVLSAGCIVQDRPHEGNFFVVADAGENQVLAVGETAHFEWAENRTVKAEGGEPPHVEVEYAWLLENRLFSLDDKFTLWAERPLFALVELSITARETTATDAVGVLWAPDALDSSRGLYLAAIGPLTLRPPTDGGPLVYAVHTGGAHSGFSTNVGLPPGNASIRVTITLPEPQFPPEPVKGSLFLAVKDGPGVARGVATGPLEFEPENAYTLWVDPSAAGHHKVEVRDQEGALISNTSIEEFETAHAGEEEVEVLVSDAQTLPGFEGLAALTATFVVAALLVAARRRL